LTIPFNPEADQPALIEPDRLSDTVEAIAQPDFSHAVAPGVDELVLTGPINRGPIVHPRQHIWRDMFEFALLLISIYALVNLTTARAVVEGISMQPNFFTGQLIVVNRLIYYFAKPARGDVIVLHDPEDPSQDFIKRVVGLPGEQIAIRAGRVYVNGTMLEEPYIATFCTSCDGTWELDADHYFVLGDNRPNSHDSHAFGPLDRRLIVGKAWLRYWPFPDFGFIPSQLYGSISSQRPAAPPPTVTPIPVTPQPTTPRSPVPPGTVIPRHPDTSGGSGRA
jgi:signal peptidase I